MRRSVGSEEACNPFVATCESTVEIRVIAWPVRLFDAAHRPGRGHRARRRRRQVPRALSRRGGRRVGARAHGSERVLACAAQSA
eukprot:6194428-Pleurochrysis_carterae.AAC.2